MNSDHLGDSYDLAKGTIIGWLGGDWVAHPMLTKRMDRDSQDLLKRLLGVSDLLSTSVLTPSDDRDAYLRSAREHTAGHVFLDPDTGIFLEKAGRSPKHLFASEIVAVVRAPGRERLLTLVYDQSFQRGQDKAAALREKLAYFAQHTVAGAAYVSYACFVILSAEQGLVDDSVARLMQWLPKDRLILGGHLKTGHSWTGQNRPLFGSRDEVEVYRVGCS